MAAFHPLTPGHPEYGLLKFGAVGALFAVRMAMVRRGKRGNREESPGTPEAHVEQAPVRRRPHPVSRKKRRRR